MHSSNPIFLNCMDNISDPHDIDIIIKIITRLFILINASRLGWIVETVEGNKIVLRKEISKLTQLDNDTPKLIENLFSDI